MVIGLLLIGVAAALGAWESMWLAAANPRSRLSFLGWPPNRPFGVLVVYVAIVPTWFLGTRTAVRGWQPPFGAVDLPMFACGDGCCVGARCHSQPQGRSNRLTQRVALAALRCQAESSL